MTQSPSCCTCAKALVFLLLFVSPVLAQPEMSVTRVATGLSRPVFGTTAPGDSGRMFVVEQHSGQIKILDVDSGIINATPFLDVNGNTTGNEQGLLGMTFHPDYVNNGLFYVNYTNGAGDSVIQEYSRLNANQADTTSARTLMTISQPYSNHNAGWMDFGMDDKLYISTGDGGSGGDPDNNAQTITGNLLGKILRIDPLGSNSSNGQYGIPADNPFVGVTGDDEIWAYGLRNAWRPSFDRLTGDLYLADVGQGAREEINVQPASSSGGENYGWSVREGTSGPPLPGAIDPIYDYDHGAGDQEGFSVTGGYVYRGSIDELQGHYFFADFVTDRIWSMKWDGSDPSAFDGTNYTDFIDWTDVITTDIGSIANISSFAEDELGNLYFIDLGGEIYRMDTASIPEPAAGIVFVMLGLAGLRTRNRSK